MSDRFRIAEVSGFTINPRSAAADGNTRRQPVRSFAVLDSAFCFQIVGEFNTTQSSGGERKNERAARTLCDELNLWADEYGTEP